MNPVAPPDILAPPKERGSCENNLLSRSVPNAVDLVHHVDLGLIGEALKELLQLLAFTLFKVLVAVDPKNPVSLRLVDPGIARLSKVITPFVRHDFRAKLLGNRNRIIGRTRVDNHDLVDQIGDRFQTLLEIFSLVLDDHREGNCASVHNSRTLPLLEKKRDCVTVAGMKRLLFLLLTLPCFAGQPLNSYDPVSYFEEDSPAAGSHHNRMQHGDDFFYFKSPENLAKFAQNPDQYLPQYEGWCGWALTEGRLAEADPRFYVLQDGKLYLMCSQEAYDKWQQNPALNAHKADQHWQKLKGN